jgi:predicted transposase YbfD/YdcC
MHLLIRKRTSYTSLTSTQGTAELWRNAVRCCRQRGASLKRTGPGCAVIGRIESLRQVKGKESGLEQCYYISSRPLSPSDMAQSARSHWAIDNQVHWVLDASMRVGASTVCKDNTPINLSLLKKIILNILRTDTPRRNKASLGIPRKRAGWIDDLRPQLLGMKWTQFSVQWFKLCSI